MLVEAIRNYQDDIPEPFRQYAFGQDERSILPLTIGKKYVVAAIKRVQDTDFYLVLSDDGELKGHPWWYPANLFSTLSDAKPEDWRIYDADDIKIEGFPEIVDDEDGRYYNALEDGEASAVQSYLKHYQKYAQDHGLNYKDV